MGATLHLVVLPSFRAELVSFNSNEDADKTKKDW